MSFVYRPLTDHSRSLHSFVYRPLSLSPCCFDGRRPFFHELTRRRRRHISGHKIAILGLSLIHHINVTIFLSRD